MAHVPVAHRGHRVEGVFRSSQIFLHLFTHRHPLRIRSSQIGVVPTRIHRRQNCKQRFAGVQGDGSGIIRRAQRDQCAQQGRDDKDSKPENLETNQECLPQDCLSTATKLKVGGELINSKGSRAEGQTCTGRARF